LIKNSRFLIMYLKLASLSQTQEFYIIDNTAHSALFQQCFKSFANFGYHTRKNYKHLSISVSIILYVDIVVILWSIRFHNDYISRSGWLIACLYPISHHTAIDSFLSSFFFKLWLFDYLITCKVTFQFSCFWFF
jgi:hypothetical protein